MWARHDKCTGSNSTRPSQVQRMLDFCPQCSSPTPGACDKLANIRAGWEAKHPSGNKSGEPEGDDGNVSSDWSDAEGSSEDCSSVDEQTRVAVKSATAQASSNRPTLLPKMLLVGDSNAVGYCETHGKCDTTLRKSSSTAFQAHLAAQSGTPWKAVAKDVDAVLGGFPRKDVARRKGGSDDTELSDSPEFDT